MLLLSFVLVRGSWPFSVCATRRSGVSVSHEAQRESTVPKVFCCEQVCVIDQEGDASVLSEEGVQALPVMQYWDSYRTTTRERVVPPCSTYVPGASWPRSSWPDPGCMSASNTTRPCRSVIRMC